MRVCVSAEEPERPEDGDTAMTLPSQSNVNVHNIKSLKLLVYRLVTFMFEKIKEEPSA